MAAITENSNHSARVFLCHSSEDKELVRDIYRRLQANGVSSWLDEIDLLPGQNWEEEIQRAIRSSSHVLVCLSQSSVTKTGYLNKEIKYALDIMVEHPQGKIFIIPARLDDCAIPERLRAWQWVDLFKADGLDRLLKTLRVGAVAQSQSALHAALRLTVHRAAFLPHGPECFFINATNIQSQFEFEITHVWFETSPPVYVIQRARPLPKRMKPQETWETWVEVDNFASEFGKDIFVLGRARLSTGEVVKSIENVDVPMIGTVPGGDGF